MTTEAYTPKGIELKPEQIDRQSLERISLLCLSLSRRLLNVMTSPFVDFYDRKFWTPTANEMHPSDFM